jgi:thymidine kinase
MFAGGRTAASNNNREVEYTRVTAGEIERTEGLADWRVILQTLQADFRAASYPAAAALVAAVADAATRTSTCATRAVFGSRSPHMRRAG